MKPKVRTTKDGIYINEDDRRILLEWIEDTPTKTAKVVVGKNGTAVGDHYHKKKDEIFLLVLGKAKRVIIGDKEEKDVGAPRKWFVERGTYHLFELDVGAMLLGACTEKFDPLDEIKGKADK